MGAQRISTRVRCDWAMPKLSDSSSPLRSRQRLGKYRIERRLGEGGFANVYQAFDTIEGVRVALKLPNRPLVTPALLDAFQREARMVSRLDHPNILPIKDASFIDGRFVIACRLGERTLGDRLRKRMSTAKALVVVEQMLEAVAYAHRMKIIHCDLKPENMLLLTDGRLQLTDFGIARVAQRTVAASGSGTVGYMAPEQAMGRPSAKSDVFALGLLMYRIFTGHLPEWPFDWPPPGSATLRRKVHPELIDIIRRCLSVRPTRRYKDANDLLNAFRGVRRKAILFANRSRSKKRVTTRT
jgi:serine/threonine protein kinase